MLWIMIESYCCTVCGYITHFLLSFCFPKSPAFTNFYVAWDKRCSDRPDGCQIWLISTQFSFFILIIVLWCLKDCSTMHSWPINFIIFLESVLGIMITCLLFYCLIMLNTVAFRDVFFLPKERIFDNCCTNHGWK